MTFDAHRNFAVSFVATAPAPAQSGTSLVVSAGDGTKFPAAPFNVVVWPANTNPSAANAEIVRVTNVSTDTFTIVRTQESSTARPIGVGDQIAAVVTAKTITDIEANSFSPPVTVAQGGSGLTSLTSHGVVVGQGTSAVHVTAAGTAGAPLLSGGASADPGYATLSIPFGGTGQTSGAAALSAFGGQPQLVPTPVKTSAYNAAANDLVRCDTSGGAFTVTLPTAPADKTLIGVDVAVIGANLTVAAGGSDVFLVASGATTQVFYGLEQKVYQYDAADAIWLEVARGGQIPIAKLVANPGTQTATGIIAPFTYASATTVGSPVYLNTSGQVAPASATDSTKLCAGIALATASSGINNVLLCGIYRDDSNLSFSTVGGLVYLATSAGTLTQTKPSATDNAIQVVGVALATHILYVAPNFNYITHT